MAMQTRTTESAYTSTAEPRTIPGDMFHREDIFREERRCTRSAHRPCPCHR